MFQSLHHPAQGKGKLLNLLTLNAPGKTTARFDSFKLSSDDVIRIARALEKNNQVKTLSFRDCGLSSEDIRVLHDAILKNSTLEEVKIEKFKTYPTGILELIEEIDTHVTNNMENKQKTTLSK